ncbi:MAG: TolC family protein [Longimicrobiales bacterium]
MNAGPGTWRWLLAVALVATSPVPLCAQDPAAAEPQPLTLQQAVQQVMQTAPALRGAEAAVDRGRSGLRHAGAARLPGLALEASAVRFAEPMIVAPLHGLDPGRPPVFDETLLQSQLVLSWTVWDGGVRSARIERAAALLGAAEAGREVVRQALLLETVQTYLDAVLAGEVLRSQRARLDAAEGERQRAADLLARGTVARVDVLRADAALSAARAEVLEASGARAVADRSLARLMGLTAEPAWTELEPLRLAAREELPDGDALVARALAASSELQAALRRVAAAAASVAEARAAWLPRLQVGARYTEFASSLGRESGEWQSGVSLSYPLFTGGARNAAHAGAAAELEEAQADAAQVELRVRQALDVARTAFETAGARISALAAAVAQAEEVARIERLALEVGAGVQTNYLTAEAELLRTRVALHGARHAELVARAELARLIGELSETWLSTNLEAVP